MPVDPTLTISIDRTALSLSPLVFVGSGDGALGITAYREPAMQPRVQLAPTSAFIHGDVPLSWSWQQSLLTWSFFTDGTTETESRSLLAEVRAAVTQGLSFLVTVTVGGAPAEKWSCNPGPVNPESDRSYLDLRDSDPVWSVSLPCYPIREVA